MNVKSKIVAASVLQMTVARRLVSERQDEYEICLRFAANGPEQRGTGAWGGNEANSDVRGPLTQ